MRLKLRGEGSIGQLGRVQLASLLRFEPKAGAVNVVLDPAGIERKLASARQAVHAEARGRHLPRLGRPRIRRQGEERDDASTSGARSGDLRSRQRRRPQAGACSALDALAPELTTKDAKALGIRERISTFTTDMGVSSSNRIWNVHLLGNYLDGTIVKPGETFSYNEVVGPRTIERGFREGQMIFGGVLIPSIGGGVCQTATTIFNAAFEAGLPVIGAAQPLLVHQPLPDGPRRDRVVGRPRPRLQERPDHAILIDVSVHRRRPSRSASTGRSQGRKVTSTTARPTNYTQPKMQYAIDPTAPRRLEARRRRAAGPGFDINVHRKVYEHGKLIRKDDFFTRYTPENPTTVYGPGGKPPGPTSSADQSVRAR